MPESVPTAGGAHVPETVCESGFSLLPWGSWRRPSQKRNQDVTGAGQTSSLEKPFEGPAMGIRTLLQRVTEGVAPRRSTESEHILAIRRVLKQLRGRERALMNLQGAVTDDEQRANLADKLRVLRAQRAKGIGLLRDLRAEGRAFNRLR